MDQKFRELRLRQLDRLIDPFKQNSAPPVPNGGWLRSIREAIGMSVVDFSRRLGLSREGSRQLELAEASESITLKRLRRAANALDCDVAYILIPRQPLTGNKPAEPNDDLTERVAHTMLLEGQEIDPSKLRRAINR